MSKCIKCEKTINDEPKLYGVIEKYHYDNRMTTSDFDTGITTYKAVAIIKSAICEDCLKKERKKLLLEGLKYIGIGFLVIVVGGVTINLIDTVASIAALAGVITLFYGIGKAIKAFEKKEIIESAFDGKINKDFIIWPKNEDEINITELEYSTYYRNRYYYELIDEKKLRRSIKIKGKKQSKVYAINTLKKALLAVESGTDASLEALNPNTNIDNQTKKTKHKLSYDVALNKLKKWYQGIDKNKQTIDDNNNDFVNLDIHKDDVVKKETTKENKETKFKGFDFKIDGNKRKIIIIALAALVVLGTLGGLLALIINGINPTIDLEDYLYDDIKGYEHNAEYKRVINHHLLIDEKGKKIKFVDGPLTGITDENVDEKRLQEVVDYIIENDYSCQSAFEIIDIYDYDKNTFLSTGDVVNYTLNDDLKILNLLFKCEFKAPENGSYEVLSYHLSQNPTVDLLWWFDDSYIKYEGADGNIEATLDFDSLVGTVVYEQDNMKIILDYYDTTRGKEYYLCLYKNDENVDSWLITLNKHKNLSVGDTIKVYIDEYEKFDWYDIFPQYYCVIAKVEKQQADVLISEETVTKEMVENYLIDNEAFDYSCDVDDVDIDIISAIFFKIPAESGYEEETVICVDYKLLAKTENEIYDKTKLGMIYGPAIKDNKLYADRIDSDLAENMYGPFEDEFKEVGIDIEINDYAQLLKVMQSEDMQKLFNAGLEDPDYVEYVLYCFVNDSTYVIYHK